MPKAYAVLSGLRRNRMRGQAFAVIVFAAALAARMAVDDVLASGFPFVTFYPAVILTTLVAGLWPGIMVAVLSAGAGWYFFLPPYVGFVATEGSLVAVALFAVSVAVAIAVVHVMTVALESLEGERRRSAQLTQQTQTMFSELQHRVSNNLQLISALLTVQHSKVTDRAAAWALEEAQAQVATVGRLHRMLYNPGHQHVDVAEYLGELCRDLIEASGGGVECKVSVEPVVIDPDKLVPLALIVAELVSNSLEHGFGAEHGGKIRVILHRNPGAAGELRLIVRDNGSGLRDGFKMEAEPSLGLGIVRSLAGQIDGRFTMHSDSGTVCTLVFTP